MSPFAQFLLVFGTTFVLLIMWVIVGISTMGASDPYLSARFRQCERNLNAAVDAWRRADADRKHLMADDLAEAATAMADIWTEIGVHCGPVVYMIACWWTVFAWLMRVNTSKK